MLRYLVLINLASHNRSWINVHHGNILYGGFIEVMHVVEVMVTECLFGNHLNCILEHFVKYNCKRNKNNPKQYSKYAIDMCNVYKI